MSTILKSAAMSLLSKTLQTFLSKYLIDVDVEGVALPSMYDGSGWGVRLSNVKLREGVQLLQQMPGKRIRKKKKPKQPKQGMTVNTTQKKTMSTAAPTNTTITPKETGLNPSNGGPSFKENGERRQHPSSDADHPRPSRSRLNSYSDLEISIHEDGLPLQQHHQTNQEGGPKYSTRPTTPVQDSKSIFSCFTKGRKKNNDPMNDSGGLEQTDTDYGDDYYENDGYTSAEDLSRHPSTVDTTTQPIYRQMSSLALDDDKRMDDEGYAASRTGNAIPSPQKKKTGEETTCAYDDVENNNDEEEEEFDEYEQSYRLCVGDSGRIGTLDIRLVDKQLHVLVEDAVLTIECYPVPEASPDLGMDSVHGVGTDSSHGGGTGGSGPQPTPPSAAAPPGGASTTNGSSSGNKAKTKPTETKRDTVGDRVLADNPLARAIAAIPHLLLRDIRIRFILRDEPLKSPSDDSTIVSEPIPMSSRPGPQDIMLEIGIDFLAVGNGEDALSMFQQQPTQEDFGNGNEPPDDGSLPRSSSRSSITPRDMAGNTIDNNEYMVRHIRTGRGSDAGIWIQVFAPTPKLPVRGISTTPPSDSPHLLWARQRWTQMTNFHLLRCSGLDVRARIHLGTKKQLSGYSWFFDYDDEYQEYAYDDGDIDSMLIGFDALAPGVPSLPPMNPSMSRGGTPARPSALQDSYTSTSEGGIEGPHVTYSESEKFTLDDNGIQSCKIPSTFHRISRGLRPGRYVDRMHLPSGNCELPWDGPLNVPLETPLDSSMPLPGLALQITLRDPLELNLDRPSIETLNLLKTMFTKKRDPPTDDQEETPETAIKDTKDLTRRDSTASIGTTKSTTTRSGFFSFFSSAKPEEEIQKDPMASFSPIMQPENIQVLGIHLAKVVLRVHFLRDDRKDDGLSFAYWDMLAACVTLDQQSLKSNEVISSDLRLDVGYLLWNEFRGVEQKQVAELGLLHESRSINIRGTAPKGVVEDNTRSRMAWPSAAYALMDLPPPQETLMYRDRKGYGAEVRMISARKPEELVAPRSLLNIRVGPTTLDAPWAFWRDILDLKKKIITGILGEPKIPKESPLNVAVKPPPTIMTYAVQFEGGTVILPPLIDMKAPAMNMGGELSSDVGVSFSTALDELQMTYGRKASVTVQRLSIHRLAYLPESVRTRILFCLDDWTSLEDVLDIKHREMKNPFKRTMTINKAIVFTSKTRLAQVSKQSVLSTTTTKTTTLSRREEILADMAKLDDKELHALWSAYQGRAQESLVVPSSK